MSNDRERRRRLFFALWPDGRIREALAKTARGPPRRRGRPVPVSNLHITLAFAGAVDASTHAHLVAQAASIEARRCQLALTRIGYFARSRILWLGANECPARLIMLVRQLNESLENCGLKPDLRLYRPHVTLLRDAEPSPVKIEITSIDWPVNMFHLMESRTRPEGAHYEVLRGFALQA